MFVVWWFGGKLKVWAYGHEQKCLNSVYWFKIYIFTAKSWNERVSFLLQQLCVEHVWQTELLSSDDRSSTESQPNVSSQLPAIIDSNQLSPGLTARLRILLWHLHRHLATKTKRISGRKEYLIRIYWTLLASWLQRRIQLVEESK